jgi:hypothetical protein
VVQPSSANIPMAGCSIICSCSVAGVVA